METLLLQVQSLTAEPTFPHLLVHWRHLLVVVGNTLKRNNTFFDINQYSSTRGGEHQATRSRVTTKGQGEESSSAPGPPEPGPDISRELLVELCSEPQIFRASRSQLAAVRQNQNRRGSLVYSISTLWLPSSLVHTHSCFRTTQNHRLMLLRTVSGEQRCSEALSHSVASGGDTD